MHFRPVVALLVVLGLLGPASAFSARDTVAPSGPPSPPEELATRFAAAVVTAAHREGARRVRVDLTGASGLEGAPALIAMGAALEDSLYRAGDGGLLAPVSGAPAELEIVATLARVRGRVSLGGALRRAGKDGTVANWVLVSAAEDPSWWPWLAPSEHGPVADPTGFVWTQVGAIDGVVRDADAGDLDGDGRVEFAVATDDTLHVLAIAGGSPRVVATIGLEPTAGATAAASRAPRTFVRIAPGAGSAGEILLRRGEDARTSVFAWLTSASRVVRRGERDGVVVATMFRAGGAVDSIVAELVAGTNRFEQPPRVKRGATWRSPSGLGAWLDLRAADLGAVAMLAEGTAVYGLLDVDGTLRLLKADLGDAGRVEKCGSAYALADWDGDGKADPLCAGDGPADAGRDRLAIGRLWSADVDGTVNGIAAGPVESGTAALVFVQRPSAEATEVWLLTR